MDVFFSDADRRIYLDLLREQGRRFDLHYIAWCLMANHVHLIAVPGQETSLAKGIGEAHRRYTRRINAHKEWRGFLFQGRFFSCPLEESHAVAAVRYALRNPVRAGLVEHAWDYAWSSARWMVGAAHADPLAEPSPMLHDVDDWRALLADDPTGTEKIRRSTRTGRPLGSESFLSYVEEVTGRDLRPRRPGRKRKE